MSTSWILRERATLRVICETFDPAKVAALNLVRYEAVPIGKYLSSLNSPSVCGRRVELVGRQAKNVGAYIMAACKCYEEGREYSVLGSRQLESKAARAAHFGEVVS